MRITRRTKAIAFFITLGACLVALAVFLNITWVVFHWRQVVPLVLGIIFFGVIIAGLVVNTIFIVREIRRNERQDSFLNAVTHELKTPVTSISRDITKPATRRSEAARLLPHHARRLGSPSWHDRTGAESGRGAPCQPAPQLARSGFCSGGARNAGTRSPAPQSQTGSAAFRQRTAGGPRRYGQSRRAAHRGLQPSG